MMMNLWMRWVNFRALRDILLLVKAKPGQLRATDLVRLTSEGKIMIGRKGQDLGPSSHYHHRRTLERLGLLVKQDHRYALNEQLMEAKILTTQQSLGTTLVDQEKQAFSNVILRNQDCSDVFFQHFAESDIVIRDVNDFIERASPVEMRIFQGHASPHQSSVKMTLESSDVPIHEKQVAIRAVGTREWSVLSGINAVQAIHFGLRTWCVDQLSFLDGLYRADGVYTIYPKWITQSLTTHELALEMLDSLNFESEWTTVRVGDFALQMGIEQRASIEQTKGVLASWMKHYPDVVAGIATSERFITGGLSDGQRGLVLKGFLLEGGGAYVSHLRIHRNLHQRIRRSVVHT